MELTMGTIHDCSPSSTMTAPDSCWTGWSGSSFTFYMIAAPMLVVYSVSTFCDLFVNFETIKSGHLCLRQDNCKLHMVLDNCCICNGIFKALIHVFLFKLQVNLFFLLNIVRILLSKFQAQEVPDVKQFR